MAAGDTPAAGQQKAAVPSEQRIANPGPAEKTPSVPETARQENEDTFPLVLAEQFF
jgi:hypothetical protein